ncbi:MAG: hypothetical protein GYA23_13755 [Methanomicrobiales archaeon]|nr:hypothetical protein [Methanomicrobiales archaeon]
MKCRNILLVLLVLGITLAAGCTGPASPGPAPVATQTPVSPPATEPATPEATRSPVTTERTLIPMKTEIDNGPSQVIADPPFIDHLNVRKRTFSYPIANCIMQTAFPAVITDTYGMKPGIPRIGYVTGDDYEYFLWKYTEGNVEDSQLKMPVACYGKETEPMWNFVEVRTVLVPHNLKPANYTITYNVESGGKVIAKFPETRQLKLETPVSMGIYIPMKASEVDLIDGVSLTFTRV